jgi:8-oxo-dGTP pyrophosphatase MutT (NUDIX family)
MEGKENSLGQESGRIWKRHMVPSWRSCRVWRKRFETAHRETLEEIGVTIKNLDVLGFIEDITPDKHYITVWVCADRASGELKSSDLEFTESGFFNIDDLPNPLFISFLNLLEGKLMPNL